MCATRSVARQWPVAQSKSRVPPGLLLARGGTGSSRFMGGNMAAHTSLEARLAEVEDRLAIRELVARYCFAVDDRDLAAIADLFSVDAFFGSSDRSMGAAGRAAIMRQFESRYSVMGASNHVSHDQLVEFDGPGRAHGRVSVHAELWRNERAMITALRYADNYVKSDGRWRFSQRLLSFMYYLPVEEYRTAMGVLERNRAGSAPVAADWPERMPTWTEHRPDRRKAG